MKQESFFSEQKPIDARCVNSVTEFTVELVSRSRIEKFIESWHYSGNMNGVRSQFCFGLFWRNKLIGAAVFAKPATPGVDEAYSDNKKKYLLELRRLCCIDDTPRNTESYFIGNMIRWFRNYTDVDLILSYADLSYGHSGVIYKASNFEMMGLSAPVKKIEWKGNLYHDKSLRSKHNGRLKPFSIRLKNALDNKEARWVEGKSKVVYLYRIKHKSQHNKKMNVSLKGRGETLSPNSCSQDAPQQTTLF